MTTATDESIQCYRCKRMLTTLEDLAGMLVMHTTSPIMPTPSPPVPLCGECGVLTAEFMGIECASIKEAADRYRRAAQVDKN